MRARKRPVDPIDPDPDPDTQADRRTASLGGMVVALLLVVAGLFLVHQLYRKGRVEDCLMSGRLNCESPVTQAR